METYLCGNAIAGSDFQCTIPRRAPPRRGGSRGRSGGSEQQNGWLYFIGLGGSATSEYSPFSGMVALKVRTGGSKGAGIISFKVIGEGLAVFV